MFPKYFDFLWKEWNFLSLSWRRRPLKSWAPRRHDEYDSPQCWSRLPLHQGQPGTYSTYNSWVKDEARVGSKRARSLNRTACTWIIMCPRATRRLFCINLVWECTDASTQSTGRARWNIALHQASRYIHPSADADMYFLNVIKIILPQSTQYRGLPSFSGANSSGRAHADIAGSVTTSLRSLSISPIPTRSFLEPSILGADLNRLVPGTRSMRMSVTFISPSLLDHRFPCRRMMSRTSYSLTTGTSISISCTLTMFSSAPMWCRFWRASCSLTESMSRTLM